MTADNSDIGSINVDDIIDDDSVSKEDLKKMVNIHLRKLKKSLKNAKSKDDNINIPPAPEGTPTAGEVFEDQLMNSVDIQPPAIAQELIAPTTPGSEPPSQSPPPEALTGAPAIPGTPQEPNQNPMAQGVDFSSLSPEQQAQIKMQALQEVHQQQIQEIRQETNNQIQEDKKRISSEIQEAAQNDSEFMAVLEKTFEDLGQEKSTRIMEGIIDLLPGEEDAAAVFKKIMSDKETFNQYVALDSRPFDRVKLLNRVKAQVIFEKSSSMGNGDKGVFAISAGSTPSKSLDQMSPEEYRAHMKKTGNYRN